MEIGELNPPSPMLGPHYSELYVAQYSSKELGLKLQELRPGIQI